MNPIHKAWDWVLLTPDSGNYLFGYYDRFAMNEDHSRHLALRVPQQNCLPAKGELAEIGYVDVERRKFVSLQQTESWCHQQGCMSLWLPFRTGHFIYNDYICESCAWRPLARICNANTGQIVGEYQRPIYALSPDGRWGIALDFARIPRRGYSYARAEVPTNAPWPDLDRDGLFLVNMLTGEIRLICSYRRMIAAHPCPYDLEDQYLWLNHAIFNADASRIMVLLRHRKDPFNQNESWKTHMVTMDITGENLLCPLPDMLWSPKKISHQIWGRTPREVLIDADWCGRGHEYVVFDESRQPLRANRICRGMGPMAHLVFSPDGEWLAADTYPVEGIQRIALVHAASGKLVEIGRFRHPAVPIVEVRCDLHPRWSRDGRYLSVDTIHYGERKICLFDTWQVRV